MSEPGTNTDEDMPNSMARLESNAPPEQTRDQSITTENFENSGQQPPSINTETEERTPTLSASQPIQDEESEALASSIIDLDDLDMLSGSTCLSSSTLSDGGVETYTQDRFGSRSDMSSTPIRTDNTETDVPVQLAFPLAPGIDTYALLRAEASEAVSPNQAQPPYDEPDTIEHDETSLYEWCLDDSGMDFETREKPRLKKAVANRQVAKKIDEKHSAEDAMTLQITGDLLQNDGAASRTTREAHVKFAPTSHVEDPHFTKTLKYFNQFKEKENTPSKSRRNASLPEEIAELAVAAQQEGIEEEKELWEKYREMDFAPDESLREKEMVSDSLTEGMLSTPPRRISKCDQMLESLPVLDPEQGVVYQVNIPGHYEDSFQLRFRSEAPVEDVAAYLRGRGEDLEARTEDIDHIVTASPLTTLISTPATSENSKTNHTNYLPKEFIANPSKFIMDAADIDVANTDAVPVDRSPQDDHCGHENPRVDHTEVERDSLPWSEEEVGQNNTHSQQLVIYQEDPVFIKVIGMIPEAMFWVVAQPIAHYTNKAFDSLMEKLASVLLDEGEAETST